MTLKLISTSFDQGAFIPEKYTCDGANLSLALKWSDAPAQTKSFMLVCLDPDAPSGTFHHWAAYNIPADCTGLKEGVKQRDSRFQQAINDFREGGYSGPCPPNGRPHHYHFRLSALSVGALALPESATCAQVIRAAQPFVIETAELVGLYARR